MCHLRLVYSAANVANPSSASGTKRGAASTHTCRKPPTLLSALQSAMQAVVAPGRRRRLAQSWRLQVQPRLQLLQAEWALHLRPALKHR